jgi:hypothetical protein
MAQQGKQMKVCVYIDIPYYLIKPVLLANGISRYEVDSSTFIFWYAVKLYIHSKYYTVPTMTT